MKNRITNLIAVAAMIGLGAASTAALAESETPSAEMPMMQRGQDGMMMQRGQDGMMMQRGQGGMMMHGQASDLMAKCREQMSGDAGMMGPMGSGMNRHNMHAQMQDYMQNCMGQMRGDDHMRGGMMMGQ